MDDVAERVGSLEAALEQLVFNALRRGTPET
jgi:hypothetical protein